MTTQHDQARWRLGLLLAGGGRRVRMAVARAVGDDPHVDSDLRLPGPLVKEAARLATSAAPVLMERLDTLGWRWIIPSNAEYPPDLAIVTDPPLGLFVRGSLRRRPAVAIVGSRRPSPYGLQVARLLAAEVGRAGVIVVSGMARGIDRSAHEGALEAGAQTWAVWGTGPDRVYPAEHERLADRVAATGALITEYPPGTPPRRQHFPERNRIIAGTTQAIVVVEAAARSGALVTARLALDEGREVLAVPGSIFSELSVGPHALLRLGARPAVTPRDILDALGVNETAAGGPAAATPDPLIAALAPGEAVGVDELARRVGRPIGQVTARALELELEGLIVRGQEGDYRLRDVPVPQHSE